MSLFNCAWRSHSCWAHVLMLAWMIVFLIEFWRILMLTHSDTEDHLYFGWANKRVPSQFNFSPVLAHYWKAETEISSDDRQWHARDTVGAKVKLEVVEECVQRLLASNWWYATFWEIESNYTTEAESSRRGARAVLFLSWLSLRVRAPVKINERTDIMCLPMHAMYIYTHTHTFMFTFTLI